ncbi:MAG: heme lyase NrfEFG subunit NrfE, partial [Alphaproteobacteria bacterium]|nr:heme lyase NrfEFG subunit NrfE [Alphaproteobacteria bacterium]
WSYYVLGWGGWWFWDPVENASFMPWLAGTALLHSAIVVEKRDTMKSWTILLAILTFSLSLLGTFRVRSGEQTAVHSFANDPTRGVFILVLLVIAVGGSLGLYAVRAASLRPTGMFSPVSRETSLVLNNLVLAVAAFVILFGTLYPLLAKEAGYQVSVAAPFFNIVFPALMALLIPVMGVGPLLAWKRGNLREALRRLSPALLLAVLAALAVALLSHGPFWAPIAIGYGVWLTASVLTEFAGRIGLVRAPGQALRRAVGLPRGAWGMTIAHLGIAVTLFGIAVSSAWQQGKITVIEPGDGVSVGGYRFVLDAVGPIRGPNYMASRATFSVYGRDGDFLLRLTPETRQYFSPPQETTEAAIRPRATGDLYAVIGKAQSDGRWGVRLYYKPLVSWIWIGALIMVFGGAVSLSDRRLRVGAPRAKRPAVSGAAGVPAE